MWTPRGVVRRPPWRVRHAGGCATRPHAMSSVEDQGGSVLCGWQLDRGGVSDVMGVTAEALGSSVQRKHSHMLNPIVWAPGDRAHRERVCRYWE